MPDSQASSTTVDETTENVSLSRLDLSKVPPIYILPVHLSLSELHELEDRLTNSGAVVTYDISEAKLILGAISTARRAKFELQCRKLKTEEVPSVETHSTFDVSHPQEANSRPRKRYKGAEEKGKPTDSSTAPVQPSITDSETEDDGDLTVEPMSQLSFSQNAIIPAVPPKPVTKTDNASAAFVSSTGEELIRVVKLDWFQDGIKLGHLPRLEPYIIYEGKVLPSTAKDIAQTKTTPSKITLSSPIKGSLYIGESPFEDSIEVSKSETGHEETLHGKRSRSEEMQDQPQNHGKIPFSRQSKHYRRGPTTRPVHLLHETTSEHDDLASARLPEMPNWVKENKIYACERVTLLNSPNDDFIEQLQKIKLARTLTLDEIGVRAYSTSIASLAAYPHRLSTTSEILALPGCDHKIARLFHEWSSSGGTIKAVEEIDADPVLGVLKTFYGIFGVGATTAREFYFDDDKQWRELDDIIEYGWNTLSRVQQIGLKFYDEFNLKIPRSEVEFIASVVTYHAKQVVDEGIECIIVGGYRRGKPESGDVDIMLTHRSEAATHNLIRPLINSLETSGWITHSLSLHETNSHRDQQTLPYISHFKRTGGGFDTLDKALVVWQDPNSPTKQSDLATNPKAKNPNIHRRVDIIISPWRTIGCAIEGWTGGTTFQRDLRRYAKHVKGWKFDSSGVRERGTGKWVDVERWSDVKTRAKTWQEAERRVFEGFGLEYREPWERCTG